MLTRTVKLYILLLKYRMNSLEVCKFSTKNSYKETLKFILYPDTIPFEKLNLKVLEWLNFKELEMELVEFN